MRIIYSIIFISLLSVGFVGNLKAWDENGEAVCLAKNIYFEAGNQSKAGRLAVGLVTLNRVEMREYPDTICGVVHQGPTYTNWKGNTWPVKHKCQFSWYCDGKKDIIEDSKTWNEVYLLAVALVQGSVYDFTDGSSHYHNDKVHPYWADHLYKTLTIDNHIFYK